MMWINWTLLSFALLGLVTVIALLSGSNRENAKALSLTAELLQRASGSTGQSVNFASFSGLPAPVARYFRLVQTDGQPLIQVARMRNRGELRVSTKSQTWSSFNASQVIAASVPGFIWNAKVAMPLGSHVRVLDSYVAGIGSGRVSFLSAVAVASESGRSELTSGALHRYLAEAVWYPTALLPQAGVRWQPIDDTKAIATLTDHGVSVSLEFRFDDAGQVVAVYSAGRWGQFEGEYNQVAWEGHFKNYEARNGMRIPTYGEVGWYDSEGWQAVWKGRLLEADYEFVK